MFSSERNKAVAKKLVNESKVHLTETNPSTILRKTDVLEHGNV